MDLIALLGQRGATQWWSSIASVNGGGRASIREVDPGATLIVRKTVSTAPENATETTADLDCLMISLKAITNMG